MRFHYEENYNEAINLFNEALQLNPNLADAYNTRGWTYFCLKQYERAIQDFNKAIELNPNFFEAYANRGYAYHLSSISIKRSNLELTALIWANVFIIADFAIKRQETRPKRKPTSLRLKNSATKAETSEFR